jgi:hypothetical protein
MAIKKYQHFPLQDIPKFKKIMIFGSKNIWHFPEPTTGEAANHRRLSIMTYVVSQGVKRFVSITLYTRWTDWANFANWSNCLLWAVLLKHRN